MMYSKINQRKFGIGAKFGKKWRKVCININNCTIIKCEEIYQGVHGEHLITNIHKFGSLGY